MATSAHWLVRLVRPKVKTLWKFASTDGHHTDSPEMTSREMKGKGNWKGNK